MNHDLWYEILFYQDHHNKIKTKYVNKQLFEIINTKFNIQIRIKYNINNDQFMKLKLINRWKNVNLAYCDKLYNHTIAHLHGVHTINLCDCYDLSDKLVAYFKNIHTINIINCEELTNDALIHLSNVHTISLGGRCRINGGGLQHLKNIQRMYLDLLNIDKDDWKYLSKVEEIVIGNNMYITDYELKYLSDVSKIKILGNNGITNIGLTSLKLKKILLSRNDSLDKKYLEKFYKIDMIYDKQFKKYLTRYKKI